MPLLADLVGPLLVLCTIVAGVRLRPSRRFWLRALLGLGLVYLVTALDRRFGWWASWGMDFSTHMAFATSVSVTLVALDRRWLGLVVPLLVGYAFLMRHLGYHSLADAGTAVLLAAPATALCHALRRLRRLRPPARVP